MSKTVINRDPYELSESLPKALVIARTTFLNPNPEPFLVPQEWVWLIRKEVLDYGKHTIRYPLTSTTHQRGVTEFGLAFPEIKQISGIESIEEDDE